MRQFTSFSFKFIDKILVIVSSFILFKFLPLEFSKPQKNVGFLSVKIAHEKKHSPYNTHRQPYQICLKLPNNLISSCITYKYSV